MKKKLLLGCALFFATLTVVTSCHKIIEKLFPAFEADVARVNVTIPVTLAGVEFQSSNTVLFNLDSVIKSYTKNTFGIGALTSVKVKSIGVFLQNADALNNVSNFERLALSLYSDSKTSPVLVAQQSIANTATNDLILKPEASPELKDYLKGTQLTYTVSGVARRPTTKPLEATVLVTLAIK